MADMLTADELRARFYYDRETGHFYRRFAQGGQLPWSRAGYEVSKGYHQLKVGGRAYRTNRLAWLYVTGEWPAHQIDHINRDPSDDRIENLRDVPQSVNKRNCRMYANNTSGFRGVIRAGKKWAAQITTGGVCKKLGTFSTPEAAHAAYLAARENG